MEYSFVVPIYKDGYLAEEFCMEYQKTFQKYLGRDDISSSAELIFVHDNDSEKDSATLISVAKRFTFVKVIELSRNFGQHIALSCGYRHASGKYVGMLNVDMQEPPDQIPVLLDHIKKNDFDIVFGLRHARSSSFSDRMSSYFFNVMLNKLTGSKTPLNIATMRVMNRKFVDAYNELSEKSRYLPGLESWLGFRHGYVHTTHRKRTKGKSSYNFKKRLLMAIESVISFSDLPLRVISIIGILIAIVGFILMSILIISKLFFIDYQPGYTSTVSYITFIGGVQILVIGLAGLYIGRILKEVQNRPLYVIRNKHNF